ncbi:sigma-70 family RNA polymerase sigma factor [Roseomonas elaeocarpi]|uniref:RNA polymerase sigma factor n=1 Tax=Roseomonas elaeocarpi TaxID=907779 RepID=A0ABV6JYJ0_9PROT
MTTFALPGIFPGWIETFLRRDAIATPGRTPPLDRDRAAAADEVLIGWTAGGDRLAFDVLAARHLARLHAVALRITGNPAEAEEIAQEAMLRAWQHAARFDPDRARLGTWLYRIAANLAIDRARRPGFATLEGVPDLPDPAEDPEARLLAREDRAALLAALEELPARQRAALALSYDAGLSGAEAAAALDVSPRAVEGLLRRARQFLLSRLKG